MVSIEILYDLSFTQDFLKKRLIPVLRASVAGLWGVPTSAVDVTCAAFSELDLHKCPLIVTLTFDKHPGVAESVVVWGQPVLDDLLAMFNIRTLIKLRLRGRECSEDEYWGTIDDCIESLRFIDRLKKGETLESELYAKLRNHMSVCEKSCKALWEGVVRIST
jgi:hypothetical protein